MLFARLRTALALVLLALPGQPALAAPDWTKTVTLTPEGSHILGNPGAPLRVTAWVSYTCSHCAEFERQSDAPLRREYVAPGKTSFEVRHLLRDPIDATIAQLTNCGPKAKFFGNHSAFFRRQTQWATTLEKVTPAQRQRWSTGEYAARRRAIAADFRFYEILEQRGYRRADLDRCLGDEALARRLAAQTADAVRIGFDGTPSFAVNGSPLFGTNTWLALEAQLRARR